LLRQFSLFLHNLFGVLMGFAGAFGGQFGLLMGAQMVVHGVRGRSGLMRVGCLKVPFSGRGVVSGGHGHIPQMGWMRNSEQLIASNEQKKQQRLILGRYITL
jgi:hypothetical protein